MLRGVFVVGCARRRPGLGGNVSIFTFERQLRTGLKLSANVLKRKPLPVCTYQSIVDRLIKLERSSIRKYLTTQLFKPIRFRLIAALGPGFFLSKGRLPSTLRGIFSAGGIPVALHSSSELNVIATNDRNVFVRLLCVIWETFRVLLRALRLFVTLVPLLCFYPLTCLSFRLRQLWWWFLLWAVESLGPVFIKLGQWASTRRDLFSPEFCDQFSRLQRSVQPHSWSFTCERLDDAFGENWRQVLVKFDNDRQPIGSGCIAQVYKAYLRVDRLSELSLSSRLNRNLSPKRVLDRPGITHKISEALDDLGLWRSNGVQTEKRTNLKRMNEKTLKKAGGDDENLISVAVKVESLNCLEFCYNREQEKGEVVGSHNKVMHPGIHDAFRRDLFIMSTFVSVFEAIIPGLHWLNLSRCMDEFASVMKKQIDLSLEAKNLESFTRNFRNVSSIVFPVPIRPLVTEHVLIETYEDGEPMMNFTKNGRYSDELKGKLADIGIDSVFRMIFSHNFVHGDLHPGNILVQNSEYHNKGILKLRTTDLMDTVIMDVKRPPPLRLVFLDCGIAASLGERDFDNMFCVFTAVVRGNGEEVGDLFLKHTRNHECRDVDGFRRDMAKIVSEFSEGQKNSEDINVSSVIKELFGTLIRHKVQLEGNFAMVILSMMIIEGLGHSLKPNLDILEKARPFLMERHRKELNDLHSPF